MASDQDTAGTSGSLVSDLVDGTETIGSSSLLHGVGVLVIRNTANVHGRVGRQEVLGTTGSVLGSATSNVDNIKLFNNLVVPYLKKNVRNETRH